MMRVCFLLCLTALLMAPDAPKGSPNNSSAPVYTADGRLVFPANYREWIYLTTGMDMDYNPDPAMAGHSMFDNVFVNPEAYKAFVATGAWPDKTMLVLEGRMAANKGSINKSGHYQTNDVMNQSIHIKDESRFPGKWAFFGFDEGKPAKQIPTKAACYSCHEQHGAVDTTFVQFYPTLLEIAKKKGTLAQGYLKEESATAVEVPRKDRTEQVSGATGVVARPAGDAGGATGVLARPAVSLYFSPTAHRRNLATASHLSYN